MAPRRAAALAAAVTLAMAPAARAQMAVACVNCVTQPTFAQYVEQFATQISAITAALTSPGSPLILAVDHVGATVTGSSAIQIKATQTAATQMMDHARQVATAKPLVSAQDQHDIGTMPAACSMGTGALFTRARAAAAAAAQNIVGALSQSGSASQDAAVLAAYQDYQGNYAPGRPLAGADVIADTIFGGATYADAAAAASAEAYAFNLANAPLPSPLPPTALATHAGKVYLMQTRSQMARASASANALAQIEGDRTPVPGSAQMIQQMWGAEGSVIAPGGTPPQSDISAHALDQIEVQRRYENPNWYVQIAAASPANLTREIAYMLALGLHLQEEQLARLERLELLDASINSNGLAAAGSTLDQLRARALSTTP